MKMLVKKDVNTRGVKPGGHPHRPWESSEIGGLWGCPPSLKHKLETDDDVVSKKCIKCHKYRVYFHDICSNCDPTLNERKEYKVVSFLNLHENEKLHDFVHNRIVPNNDGIRYRPDLLFSFCDSAIIVEIDEFQPTF